MDFDARYILIKPPTPEILEQRLKDSAKDASAIESVIKSLPSDLDDAKVAELFNTTVTNEDQDQAAKALAAFIFDKEAQTETGQPADDGEDDTAMKDDEEAPEEENGDKAEEEAKETDMPDAETS
jgi:THO complex subunit 1